MKGEKAMWHTHFRGNIRVSALTVKALSGPVFAGSLVALPGGPVRLPNWFTLNPNGTMVRLGDPSMRTP